MGVCIQCSRAPGEELKPADPIQPSRDHIRTKYPGIDERAANDYHQEAPSAIISNKVKQDSDISLILSVLKNHYIFNSIDKESQMSIIKKVKCYEMNKNQLVFEQGQPGVCFFVVSSGKLEVRANDKRAFLGPGDSFGELALLDDRPRTATIRTVEPTIMWGLDRNTFTKTIKKIRIQEYQQNKAFINSIGLFSNLTAKQKEALLVACVTQKWAAGQVIIKEGDNGNMFYIIVEGVAVINPEKLDSKEVRKGEYFGEHALLFQSPRLATVIAATDIKLISIGRESLIEVLGNNLEFILFRNSKRIAMEKSSVLSSLSNTQLESIIDATKMKKFQSGEIVAAKGCLKSQQLLILVRGKLVLGSVTYQPLMCIGDEEMVSKSDDVFEYDLVSFGESDIGEITSEAIEKCIGGEIAQVTIHNDASGVLRQVQLLRGLSPDRINALILALKIVNFEDGHTIVQQNDPGHSFFIIKSGVVKVYRNENFIRSITKNDYFGERSVLFNDFRTATVVADGQVSCWTLDREDFMHIINKDTRDKLSKRIEMQDTSVFLEELIPVKAVGTGALGNVVLSVNSSNKMLYALKSITRAKIDQYHIHSNLILEKQILMQLDHIMIVKLIKTFKDTNRIYFLLEYVRGKDLFDVLLELNKISEDQTKFFTACLMMTLEYLHERNIIHRDLKPENIIIDDEGYIKLIDFAAASIIEDRTYTSIGTPHYLAPEIILRVGYSFGVDWWSLGVLIHEMAFGYMPFGNDDEDPIVIYEKILKDDLDFHGYPYKSSHFKGILAQLLNRNPAARICGGFSYLKGNQWFEGFNWDRLISRQLRPHYIPKCQFNDDEITSALQNPKDLNSFLTEIETAQSKLLYKRRTQAPPGKNWDDNF